MANQATSRANTAATPVSTSETGSILRRSCSCGTHTIAGSECANCVKKNNALERRDGDHGRSDTGFSTPQIPMVQRKLIIGSVNDPLEQEADRVADQVSKAPKNIPARSIPLHVQRYAGGSVGPEETAPASVVHVLSGPGRRLDPELQHDMEQRFGHDFSAVRVHSGAAAEQSALDVNAYAYAAGHNIVFSAGRFAPETSDGRRLLAHELTHVVQQNSSPPKAHAGIEAGEAGGRAERKSERTSSFAEIQPSTGRSVGGTDTVVARSPMIGSKYVHPPGQTTPYKSVRAEFDGQDFILYDGATQIMTHAGQSGKPVSVRAADAKACGGSTADSYANNPLYVGIQDFGAIPEGDFVFSLSEFSTFSAIEQAQMITGGMFIDPFGTPIHGGDWGAGRAPLHPKTLLPGPKAGCGDTSKRSGFYLHGGSLPGSSGCIDIDNSGINSLLSLLGGFKSVIPVKVRYTHAAPAVGSAGRALGRFTYPTKGGKPIKDPSVWERIKGAFGGDDSESAEAPEKNTAPAPKSQTTPGPKPKPKPKPKPEHKSNKKKHKKLSDLSRPLSGEHAEGALDEDIPDSLLAENEDEERDEALA